MDPKEFVKTFGKLDIPAIVYEGKANATLVEKVREGVLDGVTFEGVVCKARDPRKDRPPIMFKIKSRAWLSRLKEHCDGDEDLYRKLE